MAVPLRVLISEDSDSDAALNIRALEGAGFKVSQLTITTASEMEAALATQTFDVILADHNLPQFDSGRALALLKQSGRDIPFIIVSGSIGEETVVELMKAGAQNYVAKGNPSRLVLAVERELRDASIRREGKRAVEQLRESEERFRSFVESANDIIYTLTANGTFTYVSPYWTKVLGHNISEVIGQSFETFVHPDDIPRARAFLVQTMAAEEKQAMFEYRVQDKTGLWHWHTSTAALLHQADGKTVSYLGIARDITERKQMEEALVLSNNRLQQFAFVVSHDLQEPLRMVVSYVQLIDKRYHGKMDRDADEFIGYIVEGATRMRQMISDILDYSRVDIQEQTFKCVSMEKVLERAEGSLISAIKDSQAVISHGPLPDVTGDETQLSQLLQNLIDNAIKFQGTETPRIEIATQRKNQGWLFSVKDNGIGIDSQYQDKIFIIFQRLHSREEYPGTGIGLAICKSIVERHGGRIWVESGPGKGSTFYFTLPVNKEKV
jgi:PAS domain S-box-containing protein